MINYAHRGASEYAPENTLSSFDLGLAAGGWYDREFPGSFDRLFK